MVAKLILSMDDKVLGEYPLVKERMTIGRKPHNDIVIDNLAVSGEHAAVVTILNDSFLEDLDSTNGIEVNGASIKKHFLQNNDLISLGKYKLKYINAYSTPSHAEPTDFERTMVLRKPVAGVENVSPQVVRPTTPPPPVKPVVPPVQAAPEPKTLQSAVVQILTGPHAGKELGLVKSLTTLGKPGVQVAVLTRRPQGYFITHVEGATHPVVNGQAISDQPHLLSDHDLIELAGTKMEFYLKA